MAALRMVGQVLVALLLAFDLVEASNSSILGSRKNNVGEGFRFLSTGPCAMNENAIHKYGVTLAASNSIMATGGVDGRADVQCIVTSCEYIPDLTYAWTKDMLPEKLSGKSHNDLIGGIEKRENQSMKAQASNFQSYPRCERGTWTPLVGSKVAVSVFQNFVGFGGAGCVEVHQMNEQTGWNHVVSLPTSLQVSRALPDGSRKLVGNLNPSLFASRVAMDDGIVLATAALDTPSAPAVVAVFGRLGASWEQVDLLQCEECTCLGEARLECFGHAIAVHNDLVAVGYPVNGSVHIFQRQVVPDSPLALSWQLNGIISSSWNGGPSGTMFGASLSLGSQILVVGFPSTLESGARLYSIRRELPSNAATFEVVYDTRAHCCNLGLPCCASPYVGEAVALSEFVHAGFASQATVAIGDPHSAQVLALTCNTSLLQKGGNGACQFSASIIAGYERVHRDDNLWGFGGSVAMGGQAVLVGDASEGCEEVGLEGRCGTVCEAASCAPGNCLMYDFSTDTDFCQRCAVPEYCPGGITSCMDSEGGTLWAMTMSTALFFVLFCCLYSLSAWARGAGILDVISEVFCCGMVRYVPGRGIVFGAPADDPLLGQYGHHQEPEEQSESEDETEGYIPPSVREAFRANRAAEMESAASNQAGEQEEDLEAGAGEEGSGGEDGEAEESAEEQAEKKDDKRDCNASTKKPSSAKQEQKSESRSGDMESGEAGQAGAAEAEDSEGPKVDVSLNYFCCKVCFDRPIQTVLIPCGHEALCKKCSKKMKVCPICRKTVQRVQPVLQI